MSNHDEQGIARPGAPVDTQKEQEGKPFKPQTEGHGKKRKGLRNLIVGVALVGIGGGGTYYFLNGDNKPVAAGSGQIGGSGAGGSGTPNAGGSNGGTDNGAASNGGSDNTGASNGGDGDTGASNGGTDNTGASNGGNDNTSGSNGGSNNTTSQPTIDGLSDDDRFGRFLSGTRS